MADPHAVNSSRLESLDTEEEPLLTSFAVGSADDHGAILLPPPFSEERKKMEEAFVKKLDRKMSILILIYILNYMDRNNAAAARLHGFEEDLGLHGHQFATLLSVLYIGYILMQIPSNMFLNYFGKPSKYLPWCMVGWGALSVLTGFTTNFFGALCTRFFLGFVEAAFFPGALFLLSKWYKKSELSERTALLTCGILLSNAFGALIASGILDFMDGVLGFAAWRWLFFVEGTFTILVAFWSMTLLPDFPENSTGWITPAERALAIQRMLEDQSSRQTESVSAADSKGFNHQMIGLRLALTDWKVWWLTMSLSVMVLSLSFGVYFPTLAATMGYSASVSLLLTAPPWLVGAAICLWVSRHSDKTGERCKYIAGSLFVGIVGFCMAMSSLNNVVRYISLFFVAQSYAAYICFLAWASGTIPHPPAKRAVALALINCVSQSGNIVGSYIWPRSWGPSYNMSFTITAFMSALAILMCVIFRAHLASLNRKAERLEAETGDKVFKYTL
ncbi:major facilitator superfamily domain-containing protein [Panaeolus papilionaceus]|nr:major facilitator superfamily domain-containing protein [Panaeolus papilionaceus]